jgi:hypothetical protein
VRVDRHAANGVDRPVRRRFMMMAVCRAHVLSPIPLGGI